MKVIDLDSWETGYADGELGRETQCPTGCDCHPLSYSIGYHAGCKARAGARSRLHDSAIRDYRSRCDDLDRSDSAQPFAGGGRDGNHCAGIIRRSPACRPR
jgi:hypothetical protein